MCVICFFFLALFFVFFVFFLFFFIFFLFFFCIFIFLLFSNTCIAWEVLNIVGVFLGSQPPLLKGSNRGGLKQQGYDLKGTSIDTPPRPRPPEVASEE